MPAKKKATTKKATPKESAKETKEQALQPELNIGLVGHVDHGKTTLTEKLSGKWTDTHSEELKRGITIRLGYANANFYKYDGEKDFAAYSSILDDKTKKGKPKLVKKISLIDAPGHESLMATMLSGAMIMDVAILMVAANEECPQPQTREHVQALEIIGIKNVIVVQNKIDLVTAEQAQKQYQQIKEFLKDTDYKDAPIVPVSAQQNLNIDVLIGMICEHFPTPKRDDKEDPVMLIARSFDINKPGSQIKNLQGGVLGGAIVSGAFKVGDQVEINPGYSTEEANQKIWHPLKTEVIGMMSGSDPVQSATPGGSIALLTKLDPAIIKSDSLSGNVVTAPGKGYPVWEELELEAHLLKRVVGSKQDLDVGQIKASEVLMLNVNSSATIGMVSHIGKKTVTLKLKRPVSAGKEQRVTISRMIGSRFRLIGFGIIK